MRREGLPYLLVFVLAVLAHGNAAWSGFAMDDGFYVTRNVAVQTFEVTRLVAERCWAGAGDPAPNWRPAAMLSFGAQYAVAGPAPWSFHVFNVLLHGVTSVLLFVLALRLTGAAPAAFVGAALFAVHPAGVEAVSGIGHRADLMACFFGVAALLLHGGEQTRARAAAAIAVFGLACASKELGITVLVPMLAYDIAVRSRGRVSELARILRGPTGLAWAGYAAISVAYLVARQVVVGGFTPPTIAFVLNPLATEPVWVQKVLALSVLARSIGLLFWPARLSVDYGFHVLELDPRHAWPGALVGLLAVAALAYVAVRSARARPALTVGLAFAGAAWLPVSNLLFPIEIMMAERFLYLPLAGAGVALAGALASGSWRWLVPAAAAALLALATRTVVRTFDWRDDATLHRAAAAAYPQAAKAQAAVGTSYLEQRDYASAIAAYTRALSIYPGFTAARTSYADTEVLRAQALRQRGDRMGALAAYARALAVWPDSAAALSDRAALLRETGRPLEAIASARRAVELAPADAIAWYNYAVELEHAGMLEELVSALRAATARFPRDAGLLDFRRVAEARAVARQRSAAAPSSPRAD